MITTSTPIVIIERSLRARHCADLFASPSSLNLHLPVRWVTFSTPRTVKEAEAQEG